MKTPPSLVIFDCDGVLVNTEPITLAVMHGWLNRCGMAISYDEVAASYKGTYLEKIQAELEAHVGGPVPGFVEGYRSLMFAEFAKGIEPIPGVLDVFDALDAAGIPFCVGSNAPHIKMESSLPAAGLVERLGGLKRDGGVRIFSADDVAAPKPAPDLFLHAAEQMGHPPADSVVIEDSTSGVQAAKAGGFRCIAFADITPAEVLAGAGADHVVTQLTEIIELIGISQPS